MKRFLFHVDPLAGTAVFGIAVLAAGFMLSWGAEAAEGRFSQGLILAVVALITVLPEYAVDMYYAFQAGKHPQSPYIHYAAANMTGANRLLIGLGWPLLFFLHWHRNREKAIALASVNAVEIGFLLLASAYAFVILMEKPYRCVRRNCLVRNFRCLSVASRSTTEGRKRGRQ